MKNHESVDNFFNNVKKDYHFLSLKAVVCLMWLKLAT